MGNSATAWPLHQNSTAGYWDSGQSKEFDPNLRKILSLFLSLFFSLSFPLSLSLGLTLALWLTFSLCKHSHGHCLSVYLSLQTLLAKWDISRWQKDGEDVRLVIIFGHSSTLPPGKISLQRKTIINKKWRFFKTCDNWSLFKKLLPCWRNVVLVIWAKLFEDTSSNQLPWNGATAL